jgi:hypothetical protein
MLKEHARIIVIVNTEKYIKILHRSRDAVRMKRLENGEPTVGFTFTTMLQHTGQFWRRISQQRTI